MSYENWKIEFNKVYVEPSMPYTFVIYNVYDDSGELDDSIRVCVDTGGITDMYSMDYGEFVKGGAGDDYHDFIASRINNLSLLHDTLGAHASPIGADDIVGIPDSD